MDLLIHAIIWLFKALFGDSEEQARVGPRRESDGSSGGYKRGPYDYGDGRSSGSSGGSKTLAELLEEARRQSGAQQKRTTSPTPVAPAPAAQAQARNAPQGTRSLADLLDEARRQSGPQQTAAPAPAQRAAVPPPPRPMPAAPNYSVPPPPQPQQQRKKKRKRRDEPRPATAPAPQALPAGMHGMRTMQGPEGMRGMHGMRAAKTHRGVHIGAVGREVGQFVASLRDSRGEEKRVAGARAVAMLEVFGAPRSKRPHRPGARLF